MSWGGGGGCFQRNASQNLYVLWGLGRCSPTPRRNRVPRYYPLLPPRERLTVVGQGLPPGLPQALLLRLCISLGQAGCGEQGWWGCKRPWSVQRKDYLFP